MGIRTIKAFIQNGVTSGTGVINKTLLTLTHSQILTLPTTPVIIVPALGVNKGIIFIAASLSSNIVTPYTNIDSTAALQIWNGSQGGFELTPLPQTPGGKLNDILTHSKNIVMPIAASYDNFFGLIPYNTSLVANNSNTNGVVQIINGVIGNLTGGNSANTLKIALIWFPMDL